MTQATAHYQIDPCRAEIGSTIHRLLVELLPAGASLSLNADAISRLLEQPPDSKLGDYALPCFRFAKDLQKKPQDLATALAEALNQNAGGWVLEASVASAFLNLTVDKRRMAAAAIPAIIDGSYFTALAAANRDANKRVMIEFSQPNTHKEFHVGHGRNVCLGNSVVRLFRYAGYHALGANYFGDDGTHISTVLWHMSQEQLSPPPTGRGAWLGSVYVSAKKALAALEGEDKTAALAKISAIHRQVETKQEPIYNLWQTTRQWSLDEFHALYEWLDVPFDVYFYESEETDQAQRIVDEYLKKGVFIEDDGAIGVDLKASKLGFCILRKRDGNTLYATKDLALARKKFDQYQIDRSIYVVADEQNHHFKQVFKVLELMGFEQAKRCYHLSYGMVVLPEGKMSSRDGTAVSFEQLRHAVHSEISQILTKYAGEWTADELADTAHRLTDGAIKYGMISSDPSKEIVFNVNDWVAFDGNSGPYLMYGYARTQSILRKAAASGIEPDTKALGSLNHPAEADLVRHLYDFNQVVAAATELYKPSLLASHLFYMTKAFSRFYAEAPVLKAEDATVRGARLALTQSYALCLKMGLGLLGIRPPERM